MTADDSVSVVCQPAGPGWACRVRVGDGADATEHEVSVSAEEMARFAPGASEPQRLVEASFAYLLEREPKESIMGSFTLSTIESYFPRYPLEIAELI
ncbi:MAG TPA: hypothetical protein VEX62_08500 [Candidatus Limnocylindrales bacterium]|nr:hypothetical protein [Candidatus Limnocylindrales bacterium]